MDLNSATYKIAKRLVKECQKLGAANRKQSVENSKELNERLSVVGALAENYHLVSFDAKTLFSSAPVKEAIFFNLKSGFYDLGASS